jgi:hypothetical protein
LTEPQPERSLRDAETMWIPVTRAEKSTERTLEIPVVGPEPARVSPGRRVGMPVSRSGWVVLAALAVTGLAILGVTTIINGNDHGSGRRTVVTPSKVPKAEIIPVSTTSFDPSGGSGFRNAGKESWKTQTYRTAEFGHLKNGVGLLLDLGEARELSTVTLDVATVPLTVELRQSDQQSADPSAFTPVGTPSIASATTVLSAAGGGQHRYWLVWVTRLAPSGGGYRALIDKVVVRGP